MFSYRERLMNYGFEIIKDGIFKRTYTVYDLANDRISFTAEIIGTFNPRIYLYNAEGNEEFECSKSRGWRTNWIITKKGMTFAEFKRTGGLCKGEYILKTDTEQFRAPILMGPYYEFLNEIGKVKFSFNRRTFSGKCLVEVSEDFEPMIALSVSLILNLIIEQQSVVTASAVSAASV